MVRIRPCPPRICECGEIGRHKRLKISRPKWRAGSIPATRTKFGVVAQLVSALACHAGGRGFESRLLRQIIAGRVWSPARSHKPLPSLVRIQVPQPTYGNLGEWFKPAVLKTVVSKGTVSSNLTVSAKEKYK
jgi:hypothetical protein